MPLDRRLPSDREAGEVRPQKVLIFLIKSELVILHVRLLFRLVSFALCEAAGVALVDKLPCHDLRALRPRLGVRGHDGRHDLVGRGRAVALVALAVVPHAQRVRNLVREQVRHGASQDLGGIRHFSDPSMEGLL